MLVFSNPELTPLYMARLSCRVDFFSNLVCFYLFVNPNAGALYAWTGDHNLHQPSVAFLNMLVVASRSSSVFSLV